MSAPAPDQVVFRSPTLFVVDRTKGRLVYVDMSSRQITGGTDLGPGDWCGVCVHRSRVSGEVYAAVADWASTAIHIFDLGSSQRVRTIDRGHPHSVSLCMHHPSGSDAALLLVSVSDHHCIHVFDWESGALLRTIGQKGSQPGQLHYPGAIVEWTSRDDPANAQVVVAESGNNRVQFLRISDGMPVRTINVRDPESMTFFVPSVHVPTGGGDALLVVAGHMAAPGPPRILVWAAAIGERLPHLGGRMIPPGMMSNIRGVEVYLPEGEPEENAQVIVNDYIGDRILVFRLYGGEHLHSIDGVTRPLYMSILYPEEGGDGDYLLK